MPGTSKIKINNELRNAYDERDRSLDKTDAPVLPPDMWENAIIGKYYRPRKTAVSAGIDNDVLEWLKSRGGGHITRMNDILRAAMLAERKR